jgi:hypothetical protein
MPDIEITEECRALIAAEFPFEESGQRLPNGDWRLPIDAETWKRLQKVRLHGESISDCIIRIIIVILYRRSFIETATLASQRRDTAFRLVPCADGAPRSSRFHRCWPDSADLGTAATRQLFGYNQKWR